MNPQVVYLIVCAAVRANPHNRLQIDVRGLLARLRPTGTTYPFVHPKLSVLALFLGGSGRGLLHLQVREAATGRLLFHNRPRLTQFAGGPADLCGSVFHVRNCSFPGPGLYWVECVFAGVTLTRQRLLIG